MRTAKTCLMVIGSIAVHFVLATAIGAFQVADETTNWRLERQSIEKLFASELAEIATWCNQNGLSDRAEESLGWHIHQDLERKYVFLPSEVSRVAPTGNVQKQWFDKLNEVLKNQAQRVFELAKRSAIAGDGASAYQFIHETLHYNPDHSEARAIFGHRKTETGWQSGSDRVKIKQATRPHPTMNWQPKTYLVVSTPHFNIASRADETLTRLLADKLERWHDVWRQVFFEFWSRPAVVERWINGKGNARVPTRKFDVIFFANEEQYVSELSEWVKGVEGSTGYYNDSARASYFYASQDSRIHDTWRHEVTHQLFQESIRSTNSPFDDDYVWLGEGIAMYFESLADFGTYVTLGGFDSRRLQFSRIRKFREGFYIPLEELSALGRKDFQKRPDIKRLYSQSAGITHMLMDDNNGDSQQALTEFLKLLYQGKLKPGTFESVMGKNFAELDDQYHEFLAVDSKQVEQFLSQSFRKTELALPGASLTDEAFDSIAKCHNLKWLDLTANRVTGAQLQKLAGCDRLSQLFLTKCGVNEQTLASLAGLTSLVELDLSGASIDDHSLASLADASGLVDLRLTKTKITDAGLKHLSRLKQLETLELSDTDVTQSGIDWLQSQLPRLKITRE